MSWVRVFHKRNIIDMIWWICCLTHGKIILSLLMRIKIRIWLSWLRKCAVTADSIKSLISYVRIVIHSANCVPVLRNSAWNARIQQSIYSIIWIIHVQIHAHFIHQKILNTLIATNLILCDIKQITLLLTQINPSSP